MRSLRRAFSAVQDELHPFTEIHTCRTGRDSSPTQGVVLSKHKLVLFLECCLLAAPTVATRCLDLMALQRIGVAATALLLAAILLVGKSQESFGKCSRDCSCSDERRMGLSTREKTLR